MDALGERAYALLVVVLGLPNCLPMPPPIPLICGILLMFVAAQIVVGWPSPWLPKRLLDRTHRAGGSAQGGDSRRALAAWLESVSPPAACGVRRMCSRSGSWAGRAVLFSLALVFAAPVIGQIPLGLAVCLVGLGLVERDGYVVVAGTSRGPGGHQPEPGFSVRRHRQRGRNILSSRGVQGGRNSYNRIASLGSGYLCARERVRRQPRASRR